MHNGHSLCLIAIAGRFTMANDRLVRRRSLRDLFDDTAHMIKTDLLGVVILTVIYYVVLLMMLFALFGASFTSLLLSTNEAPGLESPLPSENEFSEVQVVIGVVGFTLATMAYVGGLIWLVASRFRGNLSLNYEDALVLGLRSLPQLMGVMLIELLVLGSLILVPLLAGPALILVSLPVAIWIGIKWSFAWHAVVLEGRGVFTAFRRSWELVKGSWGRVFGIFMLVAVVYSVISNLAFQFDSSGLVPLLFTVVLTPIQNVVATLLYGDLRARFDERSVLAEPA